jgi:hypothetical protein
MTTTLSTRARGLGRVLVVVYGVLALAATGRSVVQIFTNFAEAPLAYSLSAVAAVVYIVATISLLIPGEVWYRIALVTMSFELLGVLVVGTLSIFEPVLFAEKTMWSIYGRGYWFVPLVLPFLGIAWVRSTRQSRRAK